MSKKPSYTLRIAQPRSKSVEQCSVFIILKCSDDTVSKTCRLEFHFQNLPFSKSVGKNCAVSCEAFPSIFSPFSKCSGIVGTLSYSNEIDQNNSYNKRWAILVEGCASTCSFLGAFSWSIRFQFFFEAPECLNFSGISWNMGYL